MIYDDDIECVECGRVLSDNEDDDSEDSEDQVFWDGDDPLCHTCWEDKVGYE